MPLSKLSALFFTFLWLVCATLYGQKKGDFSTDQEQFIKELADFMSSSKKEGKKFVEKDFGPVFLSGAITPEMKAQTISACQQLRDEKFRAYPDMEAYLSAVMYFPNTRKSEQFFTDWHTFLFSITGDRRLKKLTTDFLNSSASLFERQVFYSSGSVEWKLSNKNYQFVMDSVPKLVFPEGDLIAYAKGDSSRILNTGGEFHYPSEQWQGKKGRVQWGRAEFNPETTYAEFDDYSIRIKGSSYVIDNARFYNEYFEKPLTGQLNEKILASRSSGDVSYPRFESYDKRLQIKNIFENVDFDGGFTMRGNRLSATGTRDDLALLVFYKDRKPALTVRSLEFTIRPERISSANASINLVIDNDSIFHPDVSLKFDTRTRELALIRGEEGFQKAPFINSYHEVDMTVEALYWKIDQPLVELGAIKGSTQNSAQFESRSFYKLERYRDMMGLSMVHPLIELRDLSRELGRSAFTLQDYMRFLRLNKEQCIVQLINLANGGFVTYDEYNEWIVINEKAFQYIENSAGKRDYDVLTFDSNTGGASNAKLSLLDYSLAIRGIERILLSDSHSVNILPTNQEVLLKKNRDFQFGGRVQAGNFEFIGREYYFNYEEFKVDLLAVDSCRIYVDDGTGDRDMYGRPKLVRVRNVLEEISGELRIDAPTNKAGTQSKVYPQYPILTTRKESYVYYDSGRIQKGAYKRDDFFYRVEPFVIDSLDYFSRDNLNLTGTLVSGGIFPDIPEPIRVMEDNALGFRVNTGGAGLPLYKDKAKFTDEITLNYNGLQGAGDLAYLTSLAASEQFVFLPKQTIGRTTSFSNTERRGSPEVPKVAATTVDIVFDPVADQLKASTVKNTMTFFEAEADLEGSLNLQPKGMTGKGDMFFAGATLGSEHFKYTARAIKADTSNFKLNEIDADNLAFRTDNVSANVDFDDRVGEFKSNDGETKIEFPANMYICYMDQFKWFMDKNEMELSSNRQATEDFVIDTDEDAARSNFYSINEFQDSLNFLSPKAVYDVKASLISCTKVNHITVGDSRVLPDSGKVLIRRRAKMDPLTNASVISNYVTQYHRIFGANLEINGRKKYEGSGKYIYVDESKREQVIEIDKFRLDTTLQTIANGKIPQEAEFMLSPFFEFQGDFTIAANQQYLTFTGGTRLMHGCENLERNWFKFSSMIDPEDLFIPVDSNMRDIGMAKLGAGLLMSNSSPLDLYGSFMSRKVDRKDIPVIEPAGFLYFDKASRQYKIGTKEKIRQPKLPGNLVALNVDECEITGDGRIDYEVDLGHIQLASFGDYVHNNNTRESQIQGVLALDFFFDDAVLKYLAEQLEKWPGLQPVDISKTSYEKSIREIVGLEDSDKIISELALSGQLKRLPAAMQSTFFFADVKFEWDPVEESFVSVGPLGIASLGKRQVFRYIKGKIEFARTRSSDILRVYLHFDDDNWIFMDYKLGIMNISTSDKGLVEVITGLKDDKRRTKDDDGKKFTYQMMASKKKRNDFVDRFRDFD